MSLNEQQLAFFNKVIEGNFKNLVLLGEAGTGKTYTLVETISYLAVVQEANIIVAAPTHSALETIKNKFDAEILDCGKIVFKTLASLLCRYGVRSSIGTTFFVEPSQSNSLLGADYVFVDEISMIGEKEQQQLLNSGVKTVYTGDLSQLPAVMQTKATWDDVETFTLTIQQRQKGDIYSLALKCRDEIYYPQQEDTKPGEIDLIENSPQLKELMLEKLLEADLESYKDYRYLTYTNEDVEQTNLFFHTNLFGHNPIYENEYIMLRCSGQFGHNGQIVKVKTIISEFYSEIFQVNEISIELENGSIIKILSPQDQKKIQYKREYTVSLLRQALTAKNEELIDFYNKELDILDSSWINWQYIYSTTVHKSQGQTIKFIFADISSFRKASNKKSLLYVAISRASESITATTLPPRYVPKRKNKTANVKMYRCLETGYISNAAGLSNYQKKRGINQQRIFIGTKQGEKFISHIQKSFV